MKRWACLNEPFHGAAGAMSFHPFRAKITNMHGRVERLWWNYWRCTCFPHHNRMFVRLHLMMMGPSLVSQPIQERMILYMLHIFPYPLLVPIAIRSSIPNTKRSIVLDQGWTSRHMKMNLEFLKRLHSNSIFWRNLWDCRWPGMNSSFSKGCPCIPT